ncbi:MAG: S41 family peptidase [Planctomycetota bacterium]
MRRRAFGLVLVIAALGGAVAQDNAGELLVNGGLSDWQQGAPRGWELEVGARLGDGPASRCEQTPQGLKLTVTAESRVFHMITQRVALVPKQSYALSFAARATEISLAPGQFDNAYVGAILKRNGERCGVQINSDFGESFGPHEIVIAAGGADSADIAIFLSKNGALEVRDISLRALDGADSFDLLVRQLGRYYSYFAHKQIHWRELAARYAERGRAAKSEAEFIAVARELLAELKDLHVTLLASDGTITATCQEPAVPNYDFRAVARELRDAQQIGKVALSGLTAEGFAYLAVGSLQYDDAIEQQVLAAIERHIDAPAWIIDLRANRGGDERRAAVIASMFADEERVYARARRRSGAEPSDLGPPTLRRIAPRAAPHTDKPILCLIGPGCVSSGEGFAKMMRALPHATLAGLPTRGASGNPAPLVLPNGVTVSYSRWVDELPDGTCLEGRGLEPDWKFEFSDAEGDPTFRAAVKKFAEKLSAGK